MMMMMMMVMVVVMMMGVWSGNGYGYKLRLFVHLFCILFFLCPNCLLPCTAINSVTVHGNFAANWRLK